MGRDSTLPAQAAAQPFTLDISPLLGGPNATRAGAPDKGADAAAAAAAAAVAAEAAAGELKKRIAALQASARLLHGPTCGAVCVRAMVR